MKRKILMTFLLLLLLVCLAPRQNLHAAQPNIWHRLLTKYKTDQKVKQLIFVKYKGDSKAGVAVYNKKNGEWVKVMTCGSFVGKNGINKTREGDKRTPTGVYNLTKAFGIKKKPVTSMPYFQINKYLYWCSDRRFYNKLIDIRQTSHRCSNGEHLINYKPEYNYGMVLDYNKKCEYNKGSAIFFHCIGSKHYTSGCIAVTQTNMLKILKIVKPGAKICIYKF